jgi:hypothetical protein
VYSERELAHCPWVLAECSSIGCSIVWMLNTTHKADAALQPTKTDDSAPTCTMARHADCAQSDMVPLGAQNNLGHTREPQQIASQQITCVLPATKQIRGRHTSLLQEELEEAQELLTVADEDTLHDVWLLWVGDKHLEDMERFVLDAPRLGSQQVHDAHEIVRRLDVLEHQGRVLLECLHQ